ncbi:FAD-dependent oxidoreductase [Amorphus sp. 3PC139-8]|uniref:oxidoreductase n=1 Tax=Amorphus sp. 3PC139-8 TaxID=2735676 RepID=UPI00345D9584
MSTAYARTFTPFDLAGVTVRNRTFLPAHTTNFGVDFRPTSRHVDYLRERARAGVGLVIVEPLRVHRTSLGRSGGLSGSDPSTRDGLCRIVDAVRAEGARIFVQITHAGRHGENGVDRLPAWGPSAVPWVAGGEVPHAMTRAEMEEVTAAYVATAEMALSAGFEGLEVHLGHGHLLHQFLSPGANVRADDYGGSFENRLRYPLEVVRAVADAMVGRMAVGVRTSVEDLMPDGLGPDEQREVTRRAAAIPGVAFINASVAAYQWPSIGYHVADMAMPPHPFRELTEQLRPVIGDLPLLTANRYRTLAEVEDTLARGRIDMVGLNRAHMADPDLIAKSREGREAEIRPCVSHNYCIGQVGIHRPITCMMNPRLGKEADWDETPPAAATPRRVLVLGGGPAGLEAARLAALAGHEVTLWERAGTLGGILTVAGTGHGRGDLFAMRDWLVASLERTGVRVETSREADPDSVAGFGADLVVLATGARHGAGALAGTTPIDPISALETPRAEWQGARVAVWDETGSWASLSVAETLAAAGAKVELISRPTSPLWSVTLYSRMTALDRLGHAGVALRLGYQPTSCDNGQLTCRNTGTGRDETLGPFTRVVHVALPEAATDFQGALEALRVPVQVIGDAVAPRTLLEAMYEAHVAARGIV